MLPIWLTPEEPVDTSDLDEPVDPDPSSAPMSGKPYANLVVDHRAGRDHDLYVDIIAVPITVREYNSLPNRHGRT